MDRITKEEYELACIKKEEIRKELFDARFENIFDKDKNNINEIRKRLAKVMLVITQYERENGIEQEPKERKR